MLARESSQTLRKEFHLNSRGGCHIEIRVFKFLQMLEFSFSKIVIVEENDIRVLYNKQPYSLINNEV